LFKSYIAEKGFITTLRTTRGDEVAAACGQLVGNLSKSVKGKKLISHKSL
jgi:23S rRNA (adenine2503-C2)-methyltransferase